MTRARDRRPAQEPAPLYVDPAAQHHDTSGDPIPHPVANAAKRNVIRYAKRNAKRNAIRSLAGGLRSIRAGAGVGALGAVSVGVAVGHALARRLWSRRG